jgi:transcription antitermination factor NusG
VALASSGVPVEDGAHKRCRALWLGHPVARHLLARFDHRPKFKAGDKIRILEGAFYDCLGIYDGMPDHDRVGILLDLLGRKVRVLLDAEAIAAA